MFWYRAVALILPLCVSIITRAQSDTLSLDESSIIVYRRSGALVKNRAEGSTIIELKRLQASPRVFGSSDPLRTLQSLPGVTTNSEIESGIHIQGSELSHNYISIEGAPVYGSSHLLGLFSSFIPSHFEIMNYSTLCGTRNRLGGEVVLKNTDSLSRKFELGADVGLFFSQGTVSVPLGKKSSIKVSGRGSYLNALYSRYLKIDDFDLGYGFGDGNVSWIYKASAKDEVSIDLYSGADNAVLNAAAYDIPLNLKWGNVLASARWNHQADHFSFRNNLFYSGYGFELLSGDGISLPCLKTHLSTIGNRSEFIVNRMTFGLEMMYHNNSPLDRKSDIITPSKALEGIVFQVLPFSWGDFGLSFELSEGVFWRSGEKVNLSFSPVARLSYDFYQFGRIECRVGQKMQNLFQTGVSNTGFPTEYWILAGNGVKPQQSRFVAMVYDLSLFGGRYSVSIEGYYKKLYNQLVYSGKMIDYFETSYSILDYLSQTEGQNYGITLMASKNTGNLTGWISCSFGRSLRGNGVPSCHERIHEFNAVLNYERRKWSVGGNFVAASGTPYTAARSFFALSNMIVPIYGDYNASRLSPYVRFDVSFNYYFIRQKGKEFGANISVYNVLGCSNYFGYRSILDIKTRIIYNSPVAFAMKYMPSISLFLKI